MSPRRTYIKSCLESNLKIVNWFLLSPNVETMCGAKEGLRCPKIITNCEECLFNQDRCLLFIGLTSKLPDVVVQAIQMQAALRVAISESEKEIDLDWV